MSSPDLPVVVGNVFHPDNKQGTKYSPPSNNLKGMQTAGGNKFVMADTLGDQKILISNSNNKGTAVEVGFQGDGSITIKSNGPVTVLSPTITLEAGEKGTIDLHAKTITMVAEEEFHISSSSKSIALAAQEGVNLKSKALTGDFGKEIMMTAGSTVRIASPDSDVI